MNVMDETYDMPVPEPLPAPDSIASISGDPLCQALDKLEASIEQPVPLWTEYADPLSRVLDQVEASVEQREPVTDPMAMELHGILSKLEYETEHQTLPAPESAPDLPNDGVLFEQEKSHQIPNIKSWPYAVSAETTRRESTPARQYHRPTSRITGQSTGIRNNGREVIWYCNMHRGWVTPDECDSCGDFVEADFTDDEGNVRCRHSFPNASEEQDIDVNENTGLDEPTDE
jgi:hypothetical protein